VVTSHVDLEEDLQPSVLIRKGWGEEVRVDYRANVEARDCTAVRGITIREGTRGDYVKLSGLHYRDSRLPVPLRIFAAVNGDELAGVVAYSYPGINAAGRRRAVGYRPRVEELNRDWAVISRVIVHPKYRATGLGARLVRETLPLVGRCHVELVAVMAEYNPFAERAGMKLITVSTPDASVTRALEEIRVLGFTTPLTSSATYNGSMLGRLDAEGVARVKEALLGVDDHLYKRLISSNRAFVTRPEMEAWLRDPPLGRLARCVKVLTILSQGKAYLYWCRDWVEPS
jgi:GNAT superfamily N-acetyltransferase